MEYNEMKKCNFACFEIQGSFFCAVQQYKTKWTV